MEQQVDSSVSSGARSEEINYRPREFLDLRFHFPVELRDDVIIQTAEALSSLISDKVIQTDCISLIGKHASEPVPKFVQIVTQLMESVTTARVEKRVEEMARRWLAKVKQNNDVTGTGVDPAASQYLTPSVNSDGDVSPTSTTRDTHIEPNTRDSSQPGSIDAYSGGLGTSGSSAGPLLETGKRKRPRSNTFGKSPRKVAKT